MLPSREGEQKSSEAQAACIGPLLIAPLTDVGCIAPRLRPPGPDAGYIGPGTAAPGADVIYITAWRGRLKANVDFFGVALHWYAPAGNQGSGGFFGAGAGAWRSRVPSPPHCQLSSSVVRNAVVICSNDVTKMAFIPSRSAPFTLSILSSRKTVCRGSTCK